MAKNQRSGPLAGLKIIEMASIGPVPFAAMMLGDAGADVVRIDKPVAVTADSGVVEAERKYDFNTRSRRSVMLDLKSAAGQADAMALITKADILLEGMRPGVMERLALGPEICHAKNPKLIYARMTGWGQSGPKAKQAGHDINYVSLSGALHAMGDADRPPAPPLNLVGDYGGGGMMLAFGVLAAQHHAARTGVGQVVDAAMLDGATLLNNLVMGWRAGGMWHDDRGVNILDGGAPFYRCYETSDGGYMAVGAIEPQFFAELLSLLNLADDPDFTRQMDRTNWAKQRAKLALVFADKTRQQWEDIFVNSDACVSPVLTMDEAPNYSENAARNLFQILDGVPQAAPAPRFAVTPSRSTPPPAVGSTDLKTVFQEWNI